MRRTAGLWRGPVPTACICLWDPATGSQIRRWNAGVSNVQSVSFSPDGRTLASGGNWGRHSPPVGARPRVKAVARHPDTTRPVVTLSFSPDGKTLWSHGRDNVALLRQDVATGDFRQLFGGPVEQRPQTEPPSRRTAERWRPGVGLDRKSPAVGRTDGTERATLGHPRRTRAGRGLLAGRQAPGVRRGRRANPTLGRGDPQGASPDGRAEGQVGAFQLFAGCGRRLAASEGGWGPFQNDTPRVFDTATGKEVLRLSEPAGEAVVLFSPDGRTLAVSGGYREQVARLVDAATGKVTGRCVGHPQGIWGMAFSADGRLLATGGGSERDDVVRVFEVATCQEVAHFTGHHSGVGAVAFTPDGRALASGGGDATILLWDLTGQAPDGNLRPDALSLDRLERSWKDLGSNSAATAYRAVWSLAADPARSVPLLAKSLRPAEPADPARLSRLIARLDANAFLDRENAEAELAKLGDAAVPVLRKLCEGSPSAEARQRAERLLAKGSNSPEAARSRRAVAVLEHSGTAAARRLLEALAMGQSGAVLTEDARSTLARLKEAAVTPAARRLGKKIPGAHASAGDSFALKSSHTVQ